MRLPDATTTQPIHSLASTRLEMKVVPWEERESRRHDVLVLVRRQPHRRLFSVV